MFKFNGEKKVYSSNIECTLTIHCANADVITLCPLWCIYLEEILSARLASESGNIHLSCLSFPVEIIYEIEHLLAFGNVTPQNPISFEKIIKAFGAKIKSKDKMNNIEFNTQISPIMITLSQDNHCPVEKLRNDHFSPSTSVEEDSSTREENITTNMIENSNPNNSQGKFRR